MTDQEYLDWLEDEPLRLELVRVRMNSEECGIRDAVDWFIAISEDSENSTRV